MVDTTPSPEPGERRTTSPLRGRRAAWAAGVVALSCLLGLLGLLAFAADRLFPPDLSRLTPSTQVVDREGVLLRAFLTDSGEAWRLPATSEDVDPLYLSILMAFEDRRFFHHPGVDPLAVLRAAGQALGARRVVSGASTLSMQAARLLEPRPDRTVGAKFLEMARAVQLTAHLGRDTVLGAYLTLAPMGGNLEGVRAGSLAWLGKEPKHLTPGEAALLVALPQSPETLRPDRFPKRALAARNKVLDRAVAAGVLDLRRGAEAKADPLPQVRHPMPFLAPHVTGRLARAAPPGSRIRTTLDAPLQRAMEDLARTHVETLEPGQSLALIIAESRTGAIRAEIGSPDVQDQERDGAMDMTRAIRSPGSALKPLIYGMALERHLIHPETLVMDRPARFGAYTPANFGDTHWGEVTVRQALVQSLNVPAVALLDRVGPLPFAARLETAGIPLRLPRGVTRPGLPLALGGLGVTLEELTGIYAAIDAGGAAPPLSPLPNEGQASRRILEAAAAWYLADMLADSPPPPGRPPRAAEAPGQRTIAYKTGTSYGFRDAWSVGFDGDTTIGVWVGRPDGTPTPGAIGRDTAAPLLFDAFERLPKSLPPTRPRPPGVFVGANADLPPALRRLDGVGDRKGLSPLSDRDGLAITFPPDGTTLDLGGTDGVLSLAARGGQRPLTWLVDGRPVPSLAHARSTHWATRGPGKVAVTVVDAEGHSARVGVWLVAPEGVGPPIVEK
ncbi:MAG: penicillin-binding protein 1C [Rhodospirillum sp.]|nr:penicillin-binding protein 1C [Rhodospirillum sp.]MCF8489839.1 penicillin-binding protein 1C [Rhodospirillum sp.]MCF8499666.1 penicillin-binding protein 1C [Rhodospirillum sp.]